MLKPTAKWAPLVLRLALGVILVFAALSPGKVTDPKIFVEIVRSMASSYLPEFLIVAYGYAVPYVELVAGLFLILGLFTRLTGVVTALMFASFIIGVGLATPDVPLFMDPTHKTIPNETFTFLAMAISLALTGGGAWSLDKKFAR